MYTRLHPASIQLTFFSLNGSGFSTARGQLIRAILFPKASNFNFEKQTFMFMRILFFVLLVGISIQVSIYVRNKEPWKKTILDLLNLVTIAIPPALPLALSIGTSVAMSRLKTYGIFCSDSKRISAAGRVNCLCFDKTGTLTTDGLTLKGVLYLYDTNTGSTTNGASTNGSTRMPGEGSSKEVAQVKLGPMVEDVTNIHSSALSEVRGAKGVIGKAMKILTYSFFFFRREVESFQGFSFLTTKSTSFFLDRSPGPRISHWSPMRITSSCFRTSW